MHVMKQQMRETRQSQHRRPTAWMERSRTRVTMRAPHHKRPWNLSWGWMHVMKQQMRETRQSQHRRPTAWRGPEPALYDLSAGIAKGSLHKGPVDKTQT